MVFHFVQENRIDLEPKREPKRARPSGRAPCCIGSGSPGAATGRRGATAAYELPIQQHAHTSEQRAATPTCSRLRPLVRDPSCSNAQLLESLPKALDACLASGNYHAANLLYCQ